MNENIFFGGRRRDAAVVEENELVAGVHKASGKSSEFKRSAENI